MSMIGLIGLLVAFAGIVVSIVCFVSSTALARRDADRAETFSWGGRVAVLLTAAALTVCCAVLVFCFMTGDMTIEYVAKNHSDASGDLAWLFKLSGLWGGREGSLLFWAWLISLFNGIVAARSMRRGEKLDTLALLVAQIVLVAFVGVLMFSESNMPFAATDAKYLTADGRLAGAATLWGMNTLLEHWAMAIHPPTLFIGYAGLTIPFAYAIAALIANDDSARWVERATPYAMFSWLLLGVGIGLGAMWAYVVLGWGGYWGWDPVENASLLPWLVGVALIHSFTVYRQRGAFKRWSIMCACLTFAFVILGTFITRSGVVQSVHAFAGDPVSLVLFLALIVASVSAGVVGLIARRKTFGVACAGDEAESMLSKETAYYVNNLIMIVFAVLLAYLTVSSALPSWMPFGGQALSAGTYNAIARPLGILYLLVLALCPLLGWGKTDGRAFLRKARIPAVCAVAAFAILMAYFATTLLPAYDATIAAGGTSAEGLANEGPRLYYNGLAVVGFAVASVLLFNSLYMVVRSARAKGGGIRRRLPLLGGSICHAAMAVILVGLIGSSMYVSEYAGYVPYDPETDTASETFQAGDYTLTYAGNSIEELANGDDMLYSVTFDVAKGGESVGSVSPAVQLVQSTQQQKLVASVIGFPTEDLFVVYRGVNMDGAFSLDVRVNRLISFVWAGFGLLVVGAVVALFGKRAKSAPGARGAAAVPCGRACEQASEAKE